MTHREIPYRVIRKGKNDRRPQSDDRLTGGRKATTDWPEATKPEWKWINKRSHRSSKTDNQSRWERSPGEWRRLLPKQSNSTEAELKPNKRREINTDPEPKQGAPHKYRENKEKSINRLTEALIQKKRKATSPKRENWTGKLQRPIL